MMSHCYDIRVYESANPKKSISSVIIEYNQLNTYYKKLYEELDQLTKLNKEYESNYLSAWRNRNEIEIKVRRKLFFLFGFNWNPLQTNGDKYVSFVRSVVHDDHWTTIQNEAEFLNRKLSFLHDKISPPEKTLPANSPKKRNKKKTNNKKR